MKYLILLLCVGTDAFLASANDFPIASFDVKVVDERGAPMANIPVVAGFERKAKEWQVTRKTSKLGSAHFESVTALASVYCKLTGYYGSGFNLVLDGPENGRWKLRNPNPEL